MEKIVTGCNDCPCCNLHIDGEFYCDMDRSYGTKRIRTHDDDISPFPKWCPLKKESITITLKPPTNEQ
jgi:hypothetical protein